LATQDSAYRQSHLWDELEAGKRCVEKERSRRGLVLGVLLLIWASYFLGSDLHSVTQSVLGTLVCFEVMIQYKLTQDYLVYVRNQ